MISKALLSLPLLSLALAAQTSKPPELLLDLNQTSSRYIRSSYPTGQLAGHDGNWDEHRFARVGKHLFFSAQDEGTGTELFYCDAQPGSARLVKDIRTGINDSKPRNLLAAGGQLYFVADDGTNGPQVFVAWVNQGQADARPLTTLANTGAADRIGPLQSFNGGVYFTAAVQGVYLIHRIEQSTGTVSTLKASLTGHWADPVDTGTHLIFEGVDGRGREPWWIDAQDTASILTDYLAGNGTCTRPIVLGGQPYFAHNRGSWSLCTWDPNKGFQTLLALPAAWKTPLGMGNTIFFAADIPAGLDRPFSVDLSSGTPTLHTIPHECTSSGQAAVRKPVRMNNRFYYYGYSGQQSITGSYLFESDGKTSRVVPGSRHDYTHYQSGIGWDSPLVMQGAQPYVLFQFKGSSAGHDLWGFDGMNFGRVARIHKSTYSSSHPLYLTQLGNQAVFQAVDGRHGIELFCSDGTEQGTGLHSNIHAESRTDSAAPHEFVRLGRSLYFVANDGVHGYELWRTDGTAGAGFVGGAGTEMVADINPGPQSSRPKALVACEDLGLLLFIADNGLGMGPLICAYTRHNDKLKTYTSPTPVNPRSPARDWAIPDERGSRVVVRAKTLAGGIEPWTFNFGKQQLEMLADTNPGSGDAGEWEVGFLDDVIAMIIKSDGAYWESKGTPQSTKKKTFPQGLRFRDNAIAFAGRLAFNADDGSGTPSAWSYDPKTGKTERFRRAGGVWDTAFGSPFVHQGKGYFLATEGNGDKLFSTDGTAAGTKKVDNQDFYTFASIFAPDTSRSERRVDLGQDSLLFGSTPQGEGLFRLTTQDLLIPVPGFYLSNMPETALELGDARVAFSAYTQNNGREVMVTDGKTVDMISESLAPGSASGTIQGGGLFAMDGKLTFTGNEPLKVGAELYQWDAGALATTYGVSNAAGLLLAASDPVLGQGTRLRVSGASPSALQAMYFFAGPEHALQVFLEQFIYLQINFLAVAASQLNSGAGGLTIPIPNQASLLGLGIDAQALVHPVQNPLGGDLTNAVNLRLGF